MNLLHINLDRNRRIRNIRFPHLGNVVFPRKPRSHHLLAHLKNQIVEAVIGVGQLVIFVQTPNNLLLGNPFVSAQPQQLKKLYKFRRCIPSKNNFLSLIGQRKAAQHPDC